MTTTTNVEWFTKGADTVTEGFLTDFTEGRLPQAGAKVSPDFTWMDSPQPPASWSDKGFAQRHQQQTWKMSNLRALSPKAVQLLGTAFEKALGKAQLEGRQVYFAELDRSGAKFSIGVLLNTKSAKVERVFDPSPMVDELRALLTRA